MRMLPTRLRVLYITYWGAAEPLGQSLVLPPIEVLSTQGVEFALISFEKSADLGRTASIQGLESRVRQSGVTWHRLRYHKHPRVPATLFDIIHGWLRAVNVGRRLHATVVHGRTFVGGLVGRAAATTLGLPFIYHNEGFYPDEMVDGGFWRQDSLQYRAAKRLEDMMYDTASGLVVLSQGAATAIRARQSVARRNTPMAVVPSCVDLDRFRLLSRPRTPLAPLSLVYSGAVGGRYQLDRIGRFVAQVARSTPVRLQVYSREAIATVSSMLDSGGLPRALWSAEFVPHSQMPAALARHHAGLFFLASGTSEHGCSPTKIGEYWACGLPVVTTPGVSDTDGLIARFRAGVIIEGHDDVAYERAAQQLKELLSDTGLDQRCRDAAEEHYALRPACDRQRSIYEQVVERALK